MSLTTMLLVISAIANAAFWQGGLQHIGWDASLILIGLGSVLASIRSELVVPMAPLGKLRWALLLLPAYAIFQALTVSVDPAATWDHALRFTCYAFVFVLMRNAVLRSRGSVWKLVFPLLVMAGLEAALGFAQWEGGNAVRGLVFGTYGNRNHFAGFLEMVLPFAATYTVMGWSSAFGRRHSMVGALQFCAGAVLCLLILITLLRTLSRMGLLSALVSATVMAILLRPQRIRRAWLAAAVASLVLFIAIMPTLLISRFSSLVSSSATDFSMAERIRIWRESLPLLRAHPIFGCGLGAFATAFDAYKDSSLSFADYAHNDYLQYLIELGPFVWGFALFCIISITYAVVRTVQRTPAGENRFFAAAAAASLAALLAHSLADYNLYIPANALIFASIGGMASGITALRTMPVIILPGATSIPATARPVPRPQGRTARSQSRS